MNKLKIVDIDNIVEDVSKTFCQNEKVVDCPMLKKIVPIHIKCTSCSNFRGWNVQVTELHCSYEENNIRSRVSEEEIEEMSLKRFPISLESYGNGKIDGNAYFRSIWVEGFKSHQEIMEKKV